MLILTFFIGLLVNFVGYIPPGNINLFVVQLAVNRGMREVYKFVIAFSCAELIFTFAMMNGADWLAQQVNLETAIDWVMVGLFGVMGAMTWKHRKKPPETRKYSPGSSVRYGVLLGFINPVQIPFWMISGTYLITHEWIKNDMVSLIILSVGSACGAFLCLFGYGKSAAYVMKKLALTNKGLNTGIAILFFAFAVYHIVKQLYLHVFK